MVGLFDEARMHLKGLKLMAKMRGGITPENFKDSMRLMNAILMLAKINPELLMIH